MKSVFKTINKLEEIVLTIMFAAMVLITFVNIVMRFVFKDSLIWSEEIGKLLFVWISWLGISIGERRGEHIKITLLVDKTSQKMQHVFNILSELVVIGICGITVYYSYILIILQQNSRYASIPISLMWGYMAVLIGCALMILRCIGSCALSVKGLKGNIPLEELIEVRADRDPNIENGVFTESEISIAKSTTDIGKGGVNK